MGDGAARRHCAPGAHRLRKPRPTPHVRRAVVAIDALRVMHVTAVERDELHLALFVDLMAMNLAESARLVHELGTSYGRAELGAASLGLRRLADVYRRLARRTAEDVTTRSGAEAGTYHAIRLIGEGRLESAAALLEQVRATYEELGVSYAVDLIEAFLGYTELFCGRLEAAHSATACSATPPRPAATRGSRHGGPTARRSP